MDNAEPIRKADLERIPASEARERLTELMNRARYAGDSFILTRNGDDIAAIVGCERLEGAVGVVASQDAVEDVADVLEHGEHNA